MSLLLLDRHDRPSIPDVPVIHRSKFPEMGKLCGTREQPLDLRAFAGETPSMLLVIVTAAGNKSAGHLNKISTRASCSGVGFRRYGGHTYGQVLGTAGPRHPVRVPVPCVRARLNASRPPSRTACTVLRPYSVSGFHASLGRSASLSQNFAIFARQSRQR